MICYNISLCYLTTKAKSLSESGDGFKLKDFGINTALMRALIEGVADNSDHESFVGTFERVRRGF